MTNPASMTVFLPLREFYRSGDLVVNDSGWSILQRPLSFTPRLANVLHDARIPIKSYGAGQDGFTLFSAEFDFAYPFADMLRVRGASQLSDFEWWSWPDLRKWHYNTATRAFTVTTDSIFPVYPDYTRQVSLYFGQYLTVLQSEGFVTVMDRQVDNTRFTSPIFQRTTCRIFVNKEVLR